MENLQAEDFFFCYTKSLHDYLKENGIDYIFKAKSIKTDGIFTLYQKSNKLEDLLTNYKKF